MTNLFKGTAAGVIFGVVSVIPMLFIKHENKKEAVIASFISRFSIGFIIFNIDLPMAGLLKGGLTGLILSLPNAIVTKKYRPILGIGIIGGLICGFLSG